MEERVNLLGAEDAHLPAGDSWPLAALEPAGWVAGDEAAPGGVAEDAPERREDPSDRGWREPLPVELGDQRRDRVGVDRADAAAAEAREQVQPERALVELS